MLHCVDWNYCLQILWTSFGALAHATLSVYCFICHHPFCRFYFLPFPVCVWVDSLCFTAPLLAFPHFPSIFLISFFSTVLSSPLPLSFSLFLFSYLPRPFLAPVRFHPYSKSPPDKWGHCLAVSHGASRAQLLRAQSVKWHQSSLHCSSIFSVLLLATSFSSETASHKSEWLSITDFCLFSSVLNILSLSLAGFLWKRIILKMRGTVTYR